jgi:hypothetical protein
VSWTVRGETHRCYVKSVPQRMAAVVLLAAVIAALAAIQPANASAHHRKPRHHKAKVTTICQPLGWMHTTRPHFGYVVRNDNWATSECIRNTGGRAGYTVTTNGHPSHIGVVAFPNVFYGCDWNICSHRTRLPLRLSRVRRPKVSWHTTGNPAGVWNKALDIWLDRKPIKTGQAHVEVMIWIATRGHASWKGFKVVHIDGAAWYFDWWTTRHANGQSWPLIIFRRVHKVGHVQGLRLAPFFRAAERRKLFSQREYLLNIEAGNEISKGGRGLATTSFQVRL